MVDHLGAPQNRKVRELPAFQAGPHVVGIGYAVIFVEPLRGGKELGLVTKVPLAEATGGISFVLEHFGNGNFLGIKAMGIAGE